MRPRLPHHRKATFQRRRDDEAEEVIVHTAVAILYVCGVLALVYLAAIVAGTV